MKQIKKAVIPVAGLGTRFLPATKVVPKELLPIVDKPALQYVIEEAVESGLHEIILVTNPAKEMIEQYFNSNTVHDELLKAQGKSGALKDLYALGDKIKITTVLQKEAKGLGHAVMCAKEAVGDEWFVVLLPDMLFDCVIPCSAQLLNVWEKTGKGVIAAGHAPREMIPHYGIIALEKCMTESVCKISGLVEKPKLEDAPSDLYIAGRYLLPPAVFKYLEKVKPGQGGEIQITDALLELAKHEGLYACEYEGVLHDTGDKLEYLKAVVYYAMKRPEYRAALKAFMLKNY